MSKILIVYNDRDLVELLRLFLESAGRHAVTQAENEPEALERLGIVPPDPGAALPDLVLVGGLLGSPESYFGGESLIRRIHGNEATARIPILLMTRRLDDKQLSSLAPCVAAILSKPVDQRELLECVDAALARPWPLRILGFARALAFFTAVAECGVAVGAREMSHSHQDAGSRSPWIGLLGLTVVLYALELRWRRRWPAYKGLPSGVLVVLGIISAIGGCSLGQFATGIRGSNEGATKGHLGSIRAALSSYYRDTKGRYPERLDSLTVGSKYLSAIPDAKAPNYHPNSSAIYYGAKSNDAGGWLYNNIIGDPNIGTIMVNCTHTDTRGTVWSSY